MLKEIVSKNLVFNTFVDNVEEEEGVMGFSDEDNFDSNLEDVYLSTLNNQVESAYEIENEQGTPRYSTLQSTYLDNQLVSNPLVQQNINQNWNSTQPLNSHLISFNNNNSLMLNQTNSLAYPSFITHVNPSFYPQVNMLSNHNINDVTPVTISQSQTQRSQLSGRYVLKDLDINSQLPSQVQRRSQPQQQTQARPQTQVQQQTQAQVQLDKDQNNTTAKKRGRKRLPRDENGNIIRPNK